METLKAHASMMKALVMLAVEGKLVGFEPIRPYNPVPDAALNFDTSPHEIPEDSVFGAQEFDGQGRPRQG